MRTLRTPMGEISELNLYIYALSDFRSVFLCPLLAPQYSVERLEGIVLGHCEDRRYDDSERLSVGL